MPGCVKCVERQLKGTVTHAVSAGVDGPLSVGKHACSRLGHHLLLHLVLLRELALPSGQGLHVTAPGAGAKNPQSQGLQAAEELPVANVPAGHLLQLESLLRAVLSWATGLAGGHGPPRRIRAFRALVADQGRRGGDSIARAAHCRRA